MKNMESKYKYCAFIAYSREDSKWAQWLQKKIESYRVPASIQKNFENIPDRLNPVFTDVSELSAGLLSEQIHNALERSQFLIVICSPSSARSKWVNWEIEAFVRLGRSERIIPFIVSGTPYSNSDQECFQASLKNITPELLGVNINDLGKDAAVTKIIAYMLGVDFDTLWQRHRRASFINVFKQPFVFVFQSIKRLIDCSDVYELDNYQPQKDGTNIFISYRRKDGQSDARMIELGLSALGYKKVFFDYKSVREGKFNTKIIDAINSCRDFILVLSPKSMKNCHKKRDWVAREIRTALKYNCHIIPVVIENSFRGWPMSFPKDLDPIKNIQQQQVRRDEFFEHSMNELADILITPKGEEDDTHIEPPKTKEEDLWTVIKELSEAVKKLQATEEDNCANYKIRCNIQCNMIIDEKEVYVLSPNKLFILPLKKGNYMVKLIAAENEEITWDKIIRLDKDIVCDLYYDGTSIVDNSE